MYLCLMRHGQAEPFQLNQEDKLRELTEEGCKQVASMARWAASWWPQGTASLWASPYIRTCQTASYLEKYLPIQKFHTHEAIASGSLVSVYDEILSRDPAEVLCIVGHSPFLERWTQAWGAPIDFQTGSLALFDFDLHGGRIGSASLLLYAQPKALSLLRAFS